MRSSVVLPEPLSPIRATRWPGATPRLTVERHHVPVRLREVIDRQDAASTSCARSARAAGSPGLNGPREDPHVRRPWTVQRHPVGRSLTKSYGDVVALDEVSLGVAPASGWL